MAEAEKRILNVLKKHGRISTSKICIIGFGHTNSWAIKKYLDGLEKQGLIIQEKETNAVYWKLNDKHTGG